MGHHRWPPLVTKRLVFAVASDGSREIRYNNGMLSNYQLQPATAVHQPAIKALIRAVRINPMGIDWRRFVVALDASGELIGCGQLKQHWDGSWELASIAIAPGWRGQGIAQAIILRLLADGPRPVWLTCVDTLIPFYEPFGFDNVTEIQTMPPYFRLIYRLFQLVSRFGSFFARERPLDQLAVMQRT